MRRSNCSDDQTHQLCTSNFFSVTQCYESRILCYSLGVSIQYSKYSVFKVSFLKKKHIICKGLLKHKQTQLQIVNKAKIDRRTKLYSLIFWKGTSYIAELTLMETPILQSFTRANFRLKTLAPRKKYIFSSIQKWILIENKEDQIL